MKAEAHITQVAIMTSRKAGCCSLIMYIIIFLTIFMFIIPMAKGAVSGTFFWKPRLKLDLVVPTTGKVKLATLDNIRNGSIVLINSYEAGLTVLALTEIVVTGRIHKHLNPTSAHFYTNAYRWGLRYLSLLPRWMAGRGGNYIETHKVWRRRFHFMHEFVPDWMKPLFFFVKSSEWNEVVNDHKKFVEFAEPTFSRYYKYPSKKYPYNLLRMSPEEIEADYDILAR